MTRHAGCRQQLVPRRFDGRIHTRDQKTQDKCGIDADHRQCGPHHVAAFIRPMFGVQTCPYSHAYQGGREHGVPGDERHGQGRFTHHADRPLNRIYDWLSGITRQALISRRKFEKGLVNRCKDTRDGSVLQTGMDRQQ